MSEGKPGGDWLEALRVPAGIESRDYEYEADRKAIEAFRAVPGADWLCGKFLELVLEVVMAEMLGHAVRVTPKQFPEVDRLRARCARLLGMAPPELFVFEDVGINAMTVGPDAEHSSIFIHRTALDVCSERELLFILGHEMGHIKSRHLLYHTIAQLLRSTGRYALYRLNIPGAAQIDLLLGLPARLALFAWARRAEITCDRAGLVCTQDLGAARKALLLLACGSRRLVDQVDLDEFHRQNADLAGSFAKWGEVFKTHPNLPKRVRALELFSESRFYRHAVLGETRFPARSMSDLDASVWAVLGDTEPAFEKVRELREFGKTVGRSALRFGGRKAAGGLQALSKGLSALSDLLAPDPGPKPPRKPRRKIARSQKPPPNLGPA